MSIYVPPAPLVDVVFEQLGYLMAHPYYCDQLTECPTCQRLDQITKLLTIPFQPKLHSSSTISEPFLLSGPISNETD